MTSVCLASSLGCTVVKSQMVKMVEVEMVKMVSVEMIRVEMVKMVKVRMVMMVKVKRVNIVRLEMVKMVSVEMVKVEIINMVKLQMFKMLNMKMVKMIKVEMLDMVKMVKMVRVEGSVVSAGKGMPIPVVKLGTLAVRVVLWCWGFSIFGGGGLRNVLAMPHHHSKSADQLGSLGLPGKPSSSVVPAPSHWGGHATCFEEVKLPSHM